MECKGRFYFSSKQLEDTPSTRDGILMIDEINYRMQASTFLQNMGEKLKIPQLCINTAIVYMKRFFMYHSMKKFLKYKISIAALFLACKNENLSVKLEQIVKQYFRFTAPNKNPDVNSKEFNDEIEDLKFNEIFILMTLGFEVTVEHPHLHIVKQVSNIQVQKDVLKLAYYTASKSLQLTSLCLQYTPEIVACISIHLAALKFNVKIPDSERNQPWFSRIERNMTHEFLANLTKDYSHLFENHQPWSSIARKMVVKRTAVQSSLNLNLSIGISTNRLKNPENMQSSPLSIHQFRSDNNENVHLSRVNYSMFDNSKNVSLSANDNREKGKSSTPKTPQLKSDDHYFSTSSREILQSLLRQSRLTPNEINQQSPISSNYPLISDRQENSFSSFSRAANHPVSHSTPNNSKIPESFVPKNCHSIQKDSPGIHYLSFPRENYLPRRNFLENLESSNDRTIGNHEPLNLSLLRNFNSENYVPNVYQTRSDHCEQLHESDNFLQSFLPEINRPACSFQELNCPSTHKMDSFPPKIDICQQESSKRQCYESHDLNDSFIRKRRCLTSVDTVQNVPQYKFNFF